MAGSSVELLLNNSNSRGSNIISLNTLRTERLNNNLNNEEKTFPDVGGAFSYEKQSKITRNRQIIWKVCNNVIELEECSLDYNLFDNRVGITIPGEVFLPNVVIRETEHDLLVLFATTETVHQISLTHPNQNKYGFILPTGMNVSFPSVFNNISSSQINHKQILLTQACSMFDAEVSVNGEVYFGLATDAKTLLTVKITDETGEPVCFELKESSMMQRLWTGLVPSFVRGDSSWMGVESVVLHSYSAENVYAFTLCKDLKIRAWCIKTGTCILMKDIASLIPDKLDCQSGMVGSICLKKAKCHGLRQLLLAAHVCLSYSSQFIILEVFLEQKDIVIMHVSNFFSDFNNIQDIILTNQHVWALWNTTDGEHLVSYAPVEGGKDYERGWHPVHVKQPVGNEVFIPMFRDIQEVYMEKIFLPGVFHKDAVLKALQVFTKTIDLDCEAIPDESANTSAVKESVLRIMNLEIDRTIINMGLQPGDHQNVRHQCWSKFFSFVQQCYQTREKPLGLHVDSSSGTAMIIRQDTFGYLHNLDLIDHLYLTDLETCEGVQSYIDDELDLDGDMISQDIFLVFGCMKTIPAQFSSDVILGIDNDLDGNEDVNLFLDSMASSLITNTSDFEQLVGDPVERGDYLCQIEGRLKHIRNPEKAVEIIMSALETKEFVSSSMFDQSGDLATLPGEHGNQFLCSNNGVQLITYLLTTTAFNRMHLCRDLFVLLKLMAKVGCKVGLSLSVSTDFAALTSSSCYELLRSYHAVYWSAKKTFLEIDSSTVDNNLTHLAALHLTERSPSSNTARNTLIQDTQPMSLLFSFIRDVGIQNTLKYLTETNLNEMKPGDYSMEVVIKLVSRACFNEIWVLNEKCSHFAEYLAGHCQYDMLNEYLHLCDGWCDVNRGTKDFLLGQSYLGSHEPQKALKYFISAARGISLQEQLIIDLIEGEEESKQRSLVKYFIKVMRLFEQFEYPNMVISAASSALTIAQKDDPNIPMLWSVVFKYHLELGHYREAYAAIVHNVDVARRNDCLRHFIITLCEHSMFQEICSYPYVNMEEEVVRVIEARARTMDITVNKYYDLLYSYHIFKSDYRKAATTMYEQACRLKTEMHGLKSLQKQAKCYLASLTSLQLVDKKYNWIVRPQEAYNNNNDTNVREQYSQSPKRREDGEQVYYSSFKRKKHTKTVIIEINDLEKEYLLVLARLKLIQHGNSDSIAVGSSLSASETVGLLSHAGLFDTAFAVAQKFELPLKSIFEALTTKCVNLVNYRTSELDDRWKWLTLNEISSSQLITSKSATQQAFILLQSSLEKFHSNKNSMLHMKTVASKFLSMGCSIPSWLVRDYEFLNPAELLHLYLCYDMVNEATQLAIKYIDAALGKGKEYLGLNTALHVNTPSVWLPYSAFDQLLAALRANFEDAETAQLCEDLQSNLDNYFTKVELTTCDKVEHALQQNTRMF